MIRDDHNRLFHIETVTRLNHAQFRCGDQNRILALFSDTIRSFNLIRSGNYLNHLNTY